MLIQVPRDDFRAATTVAKFVDLEKISFQSGTFERINDFPITNIIPSQMKYLLTNSSYKYDEGKMFSGTVTLALSYLSMPELTTLFKIEAQFIVDYSFKTNPPPADAMDFFLGNFVKYNSLFHVWPYWREFIQTSANRMNLPGFPIELVRIIPEVEKEPTLTIKAKSKDNTVKNGSSPKEKRKRLK